MNVWHELRILILVLAAAPFAYYLVAAVAALRFFGGRRGLLRDFAPPVSILKPVRGLDREAYENYASFCRLDYPEYEILFNVADERDAAIPLIERLIREFPERSIRLFLGAEQLGSSNKVNKLSNMVSEARYDLLVMSDSDIRVAPDYLSGGGGAVSRSRVGRGDLPVSRARWAVVRVDHRGAWEYFRFCGWGFGGLAFPQREFCFGRYYGDDEAAHGGDWRI